MWLVCPECRDESAFEQPPCAEGHGLDCPEWFCVTCGSAVFVGALEEDDLPARGRAGADPARQQSRRRAARPDRPAPNTSSAFHRCPLRPRDAPRDRAGCRWRSSRAAPLSHRPTVRPVRSPEPEAGSAGLHVGRRRAAGSRPGAHRRLDPRGRPPDPAGSARHRARRDPRARRCRTRRRPAGRPARSGRAARLGRHVPRRLLRPGRARPGDDHRSDAAGGHLVVAGGGAGRARRRSSPPLPAPSPPRHPRASASSREEDDTCEVELRCSWSPVWAPDDPASVGAHLEALCDLMTMMAGEPPANGVVSLTSRVR